ncbi:MAG: hypothetical protein OXP66_16915 [Candidatus Tectomicrobia bacterium]|nr:hypothetical protein [Candidatus Tectomicrobia bacterium]
MKRRVILLCAAVVLLWSAICSAGRLEVSTGEPVEIRIAVGVPTVVTFPEKIKGIPTNANPEYVSMEADGSRLFVVSREEGFGGRVFVIGESDRLHILELVQAEPADTEVQLVLPQATRRFGEEGVAARRPRGAGTRSGVMRRLLIAMLRGERLPGVEVLEHDQVLAVGCGGNPYHARVRGGPLPGLPGNGAQPDARAVRAAAAGVPGAGPEGDCR